MKFAIQTFPRRSASVTRLPARSISEKSGTVPKFCRPSSGRVSRWLEPESQICQAQTAAPKRPARATARTPMLSPGRMAEFSFMSALGRPFWTVVLGQRPRPHGSTFGTYRQTPVQGHAHAHYQVHALGQADETGAGQEIGPEVALLKAKAGCRNAEGWRQQINRQRDAEHLGEEADEERRGETGISPLGAPPGGGEPEEEAEE